MSPLAMLHTETKTENNVNSVHLLPTPTKTSSRRTLSAPLPNPSIQATADHQLKQIDAPVFSPQKGEVLLHIKATGVCGSDIHFGKPVVSELFHLTEIVHWDMKLQASFSSDVQFAGVYPYNGTLQRYMIHPAKWLHKLPDNVTFAEGALLEPLSVVLHGVDRAGLGLGRPALICGAGPIGLIALASARASGAHPLVITDVEPRRLAFAKEFVPNCKTYLINRSLDAQGNAHEIRKLFGDGEYVAPRAVLECTGVESSVCTAAFTVRRGGTVMVIGVGKSVMNNLPFMHLSLAEIDLKFINRYRDTWPAGIACLSGGILDLKKLVTHQFPLESGIDALELCSDITRGSIKVQIVDDQDAAF